MTVSLSGRTETTIVTKMTSQEAAMSDRAVRLEGEGTIEPLHDFKEVCIGIMCFVEFSFLFIYFLRLESEFVFLKSRD